MHPNEFLPAALPWSAESEASVLGALMLDAGAWDGVGGTLTADQFFDNRNARIFTAIAGLVAASKPVDIVTVFDALHSSGNGDGIDMVLLAALAQYVPSASNLRRYAEIVADKALMRGLMKAADEVKTVAADVDLSVPARLDKAQGLLQALQARKVRQMPTAIADEVVGMLDMVTALSEGRVQPGIPTGFPGLDRMLGGGIKEGKQIVLAARPSIGKSSLAEQICINVAQAGHAAGFLSMEMRKSELAQRATSCIGRIDLDRLQTGQLTKEEWSRLVDAIEAMRNLPLHFDDQPALTLSDIAAKSRMLKRQHNVKLIAIDYLQLTSASKSADNRHHQIEEISRGLKALSMELGLTYLTLSQLNREVEKRTSGRPQLSDLKESGAIEEDADVVMMLSRHNISPEGIATIICDVPKNRQGRVGEVGMCFDGAHQRWLESAAPIEYKKPAAGKKYTEEF